MAAILLLDFDLSWADVINIVSDLIKKIKTTQFNTCICEIKWYSPNSIKNDRYSDVFRDKSKEYH